MAINESTLGVSCFAPDRMDHQEAVSYFASRVGTSRLAGLRLRVHDGEEIGPRMLARIAKRTGLTPDDL